MSELVGRRLQSNEFVKAGKATREKAATFLPRNVIVRTVGGNATVDVDTRLLAVEPGDTFLLSSDGLHGVVSDKTIRAILLGERDLSRAAARLVDRANEVGGPDNITVVLVRVGTRVGRSLRAARPTGRARTRKPGTEG